MTILINKRGDLEQIKSRLPSQQIKLTFERSYGTQDFIMDIFYSKISSKFGYTLRYKEGGSLKQKIFNSKEELHTFLIKFIDLRGPLSTKVYSSISKPNTNNITSLSDDQLFEEEDSDICDYCSTKRHWNDYKDKMVCPNKNCESHIRDKIDNQ